MVGQSLVRLTIDLMAASAIEDMRQPVRQLVLEGEGWRPRP